MQLHQSEFDELVLNADVPVLVEFQASWCPPCRMMQPLVDRVAGRVSDFADVYSVNIDRSPELATRYQVTGVPAFLAFARGDVVARRTGALTESQLLDLVKAAEEVCHAVPSAIHEADMSAESATEFGVNDSSGSIPVHSEIRQPCCSDDTGDCDAEKSRDQDSLTEHPDPVRGRRVSEIDPAELGPQFITIVSGLPRSGTSLMMRMLNVGGIPALCDEERAPDADNPNGYYEFQDVRSIQNYERWIGRAPGHAVKVVYRLLQHLPADREYRVIFMRRNFDEVLQSQRRMLERNNVQIDISDEQLKEFFDRELRQFYEWLPSQSHLKLINVSYNDLMMRPMSVLSHINRHLDYCLSMNTMAEVIDPALYRNRAA